VRKTQYKFLRMAAAILRIGESIPVKPHPEDAMEDMTVLTPLTSCQ